MEPQQPAYPPSEVGRKTLLLVVLALLLVGALAFGLWAYSQGQDYKKNSDQKAAAAVEAANKKLTAQLQAQFEEQNKSPNKSFHGSPTYGSVTFDYPKTWSAYVDTTSSSEPINAYFHPDQVPGINSRTAYALRVELVSNDYSQVVQQLSGGTQQAATKAKAYLPPKLSGVTNVQPGTLFSGQTNSSDITQRGTLLAIKVRDKTLEISTQSNDFLNDFNNVILASLSFAP